MEITELLKREHKEVSELFQHFFGGGTITRLVNKVVGARPPRRTRLHAGHGRAHDFRGARAAPGRWGRGAGRRAG